MRIGSLIAIYFVVWWTILFAVLPFGNRTQEEGGEVQPGTVSSAPMRPRLLLKALATSVVAAIITAGIVWLKTSDIDPLDWPIFQYGGFRK